MLIVEDNINIVLRARLILSSRDNNSLYLPPYHLIIIVVCIRANTRPVSIPRRLLTVLVPLALLTLESVFTFHAIRHHYQPQNAIKCTLVQN